MDEQSDIEQLIAALDDPDLEVRRSAVYSLASLGTDRAIDALIDHLADPELLLRRTIVSALHKSGNPRAADALEALVPDDDIMVSRLAILALETIGGEIAMNKLVDIYMRLLPEGNESLRHDIIKVLTKTPVPAAVEMFINALRKPGEPLERQAVLQALGNAGRVLTSETAVHALLDLLRTSSELKERIVILEALGNAVRTVGSEPAIRVLIDTLADPAQYRHTLGSEHAEWRTAAEGLAYVAMSTQAVTLLHCLIDSPPAPESHRAADYLARILVEHIALTEASFWQVPPADMRGAGEVCAYALDQKTACTRLVAVCVLARVPAFVSHHLLVRALYDDDAPVVLAALHVLGGRTGLKDIQPIHRLLHDRRAIPPVEGWSAKSVSESAERALIRIDTDDAREVLAMWRQRRRSEG